MSRTNRTDPLGLTAFFDSRSPVRASVEVMEQNSVLADYLVETQDGQRFAFTRKQVLLRFGDFGTFQRALDCRKAATAPAYRQNTAL